MKYERLTAYAFLDVKSSFITIIQDDFITKAEAEKRLEELRGEE